MSDQDRRRRAARKRDQKRGALLAAARDVVRDRGVRELTIEAVASRADVSPPSVYYYFASKDALLSALAVEDNAREFAALQAALDEAVDAQAALSGFVRAFVAHYKNELELFRVGYVWSQVVGMDPTEVEANVNPGINALLDQLEARLSAARDAGHVREGVNLRRIALGAFTSALGVMCLRALVDAADQNLHHDLDDLVTSVCDALVSGVFVQQNR
jgi:AcrR family transcriptional regulator